MALSVGCHRIKTLELLVLGTNYETPPATTHVVVPTVAVHERMHQARSERTIATLPPASLHNNIIISPTAKIGLKRPDPAAGGFQALLGRGRVLCKHLYELD